MYLTYIRANIWAQLPLPDYRARFFIESYIERLRLHTPHFYQSRLMNVFSSSLELLNYIHEYSQNNKNERYLVSTLAELEEVWNADCIASELLQDLVGLRNRSFAAARKCFDVSTLKELRALARALLSRKDDYAQRLVASLEDAIVSPADLTRKDRLLRRISELTGHYVTLLLNSGYSPTYLFNRAQQFTRPNKYGARTFAEQFRLVTERLLGQSIVFEVTFAIGTTQQSRLLAASGESGIQFSEDRPPQLSNLDYEKLVKGFDARLHATCNAVKAADPITAAFRSKDQLDQLLDQLTALEMVSEIKISPHCVATWSHNNYNYSHVVNVNLLLAFMSSEVGTYFSSSETSIRDSYKSLDDDAKDRLSRSLRYLSLARSSVSMDQKLLNLWIALESLFDKSGAIISTILVYLPRLYAVAGLHRRIAYLRDLLVENACAITPGVASAMGVSFDAFGSEITEENLFSLLRSESATIELFDSLGDLDHLKFKLRLIFEELRDNEAVSARLGKSAKDVERQLRRIYFLRNKIAHSGFHGVVRPQLATHLLDYIAVCYKAISKAAESVRGPEVYSISELLVAARMGADNIHDAVGGERPRIDSLDQILLKPVI